MLCGMAGAEALFADLGHFNRHAMQLSTLCIVRNYPPIVFGCHALLCWQLTCRVMPLLAPLSQVIAIDCQSVPQVYPCIIITYLGQGAVPKHSLLLLLRSARSRSLLTPSLIVQTVSSLPVCALPPEPGTR